MEEPASPARSVEQTIALDELRLTIHLNDEADVTSEIRSEKLDNLVSLLKKHSQSRTLVWRLLLA